MTPCGDLVSLREALEGIDPERVLLDSGNGAIYSAGQLCAAVDESRRQKPLSALRGGKVGLMAEDNFECICWILALDGWVSELHLLPSDGHACEQNALRKHSKCEVVLGGPAMNPFRAATRRTFRPESPETATLWLLATSGTTQSPKLLAHTLSSLAHSAKRDVRRGREFVWGLLYDVRRFAGLQVFFQAMLGGSRLVVPTGSVNLGGQLRFLVERGVNALSATPTFWRKILMSPEANDLNLRQVTLGGEIADQPVLDALRRRFPYARIVHVYATTEAGFGFAVADGKEGFPSSFLDEGSQTAGVRIGACGTLEFRMRSDRARRYVSEPESVADTHRFIDTGDTVERRGDRVFFLGRKNGTINVGGDKVQPEEVERVLLSHPGVAIAHVYGVNSAITGRLVAARVTIQPGYPSEPGLAAELQKYCKSHLEAHKIPAFIQIFEDISATSAGKLAR